MSLPKKNIASKVQPCLTAWILHFLENRQQCVRYFGKLSDQATVRSGLPQGTTLGPISFLLMINDACKDSEVPYFKYMDDLTLVKSRKGNQPQSMQIALNDFHDWSLRIT